MVLAGIRLGGVEGGMGYGSSPDVHLLDSAESDVGISDAHVSDLFHLADDITQDVFILYACLQVDWHVESIVALTSAIR